MKIKSAKTFRKWYKNLTPARQRASELWDENFIGAQYKELSGFFTMYHGDKVEVYDFLRKEVEMAEDGQAIYEFVQNAADSDSTKFYMFYDKENLIVINNGSTFSKEGIKSILNIGQSYGKHNPDKIGRYGIGFKLVHRLVGKSSGLDELLNVDNLGYRGPILFSWSHKSQLTNFIKSSESDFEYVDIANEEAPWLLKILITNFPAEPCEDVHDLNFKKITPFRVDELKGFQSFLNSCSSAIDIDSLNSGTIFYLKLGEKKYEYLERQQLEYLNGLSTSMHFLKSLDTLVINDNVVVKDKEAKNVLEFTVQNSCQEFKEIGLTEIRDKESDAKFKICFADNANSANEIKKHPNIYKYFPAVKEVNNLSFVIHSNLFELSSNRQNLTETPINKNLLRLLSDQLVAKMDSCKVEKRDIFKKLFTSILMSDESLSSSSGNGWQNEYFYNNLLSYIRRVIPTTNNNYSDKTENVKIKKLKIELNLADLGLNEIQWFDWDIEADKLLIHEAIKIDKLGIEEWDIKDIIENVDSKNLNNWISNCEEEKYEAFLNEIDKNIYLREDTKKKLQEIKLFKFSDGNFYSINDIWVTRNIQKKIQSKIFNSATRAYEIKTILKLVEETEFNQTIIHCNNKTINIINELKKLGLIVSLKNLELYKNIYSAIKESLPTDKDIYNAIAEKSKTNSLLSNEKKTLFLNLINEETKFDGIGDETLKKIELYCDSQGNIRPLSCMISSTLKTSPWLNPYKITLGEYFDELNPYLIQNDKIFDDIILPNIEVIKDELKEAKDIKELVTFFKENHRPFFNEYIIQRKANEYAIIDKSDKYQIVPPNKETRNFIEKHLSDYLVVLHYDFSDFNTQDGIVRGENLHSLILDLVDVNEHKEVLVNIAHYKEEKILLLKKLSEIRLDSERQYDNDSYEYKILDLACEVINENEIQEFKEKVIIETEDTELSLSEIPPCAEKIKINDYEIKLSKILPDNYENSDYLSSLANQFIKLGLNKDRLGKLFSIGEEPELSSIFQLFSEQVKTLQNAEQLAFLFLYGTCEEEIDFSNFKALNLDEEEVILSHDKYLTQFNFILRSETLHSKYRNIIKYYKDFPITVDYADNLLLIKEPYFENDEFFCPYLNDDLTEDQKLDFIEFLFNQWSNKNLNQTIKDIDWSLINGVPTEEVLGFNPVHSVFPSKYAIESEVLPDYIRKWINKEESKIEFLSDIGVWTGKSVLVELRKYLKGEINEFQNFRLSQETRFRDNETVLYNSFTWLINNKLELNFSDQFETFNKIVEVINDNRQKNSKKLKVDEEYVFEELEEKSIEWEESYYEGWKNESGISIFLYPGELPKSYFLNEFDGYAFYSLNEGNNAIDNQNNIYVNQYADIKRELRKLELAFDDLNFDGLWQNKLEVLEKENAQLRLANQATLGTELSSDLSKNDQKEASREAKEIVREKLESEGFEFTEGIGKYSTINGVCKDDIEYPLVVKSYKFQDEPLKIGANEWIQLMRPNSMFWVHFGNRKLGCLKLHDLLRNQDKLTISFSTENLDVEDRLKNFAELLHYFGNVHFDFDSIKPSDYSISKDLNDYSFDERKTEDDLSSDDENIL